MAEYIADDIVSIINKVIDSRLQFLVSYSGKVMKRLRDGAFEVHSPDYGTTESNPESWLVVTQGNANRDDIQPEVGDYIEFSFVDGNMGRAKYKNFDSSYLKVNNNPNKIYNFKYKDFLIYIDKTTSKLVLENKNSKIEIKENEIKITSPTIKISNGVIEFNLNTHTHTGNLGSPTSPPTPS